MKSLVKVLFDETYQAMNESIKCRDIDGLCDIDTLQARARFYALMSVIDNSGYACEFVEFIGSRF